MNKPKVIAMLLTNAFRPDPRVYKEALSLVQAGFEVSVICWDRLEEFPKQEDVQGIKIIRLTIRSRYSAGSRQLLFLPRYWYKALKILDQLKPDIIHCHDLDATLVGAWYARLHNIHWIYDAHECYPEQIGPQVNRLIYYGLIWLERFMARRADRIITVGEGLAAHFRKFNAKVSVVGNYPDLTKFNVTNEVITRADLGISKDAFVVAYIGGFTLARAIIPMIRASEIHRNVIILLAGDGPQRISIEKVISGNDHVRYLGWIPQENVPIYTLLSDVIYYGLRQEDGNSKYSSPNALFNAMAAGKPILTTDVGEIAQIVKNENCGIVVAEATPESLAAGLQELSDDAVRLKLGENAKKAAIEKYNWDSAKKILIDLYEDMCMDARR